MSGFSRPTRSVIIDRNRGDLNARMPGADSRLRRSTVNAIATMHGGALDGAYGYLDYIADQVMPDTADSAHLRRWASFWGVTPKAAAIAGGTAMSGASTNGKIVPANSVLQRGDGATFVTTAAVTVAGGVADVTIQAQTPGLGGNSDPGVMLTLVSPIAGVASTFTVDAGGLTGGADAETDPELLSRLLARIQIPPNSGGPGDYIAWAREVAGVTRAWEYPNWNGLGTVGVAFVFDDRANIIPLAADVTAMQAWLNSLAPITAVVTAFAPTAYPVPFTIQLTPSTAATQAAVQAELADFFTREAVPGGVLPQSQYDQAIGLASGVTNYVVTSPVGDITPPAGSLPVLGAITWA